MLRICYILQKGLRKTPHGVYLWGTPASSGWAGVQGSPECCLGERTRANGLHHTIGKEEVQTKFAGSNRLPVVNSCTYKVEIRQ